MTPDLEALARRAVACKAWRPMPRMGGFSIGGHRVTVVDVNITLPHPADILAVGGMAGPLGFVTMSRVAFLPDFSDPATMGCMEALVCEAWGDPEACVIASAFAGWRVHPGCRTPVYDWHPRVHCPDKATALVAALESAP